MHVSKLGLKTLPKMLYLAGALTAATLGASQVCANTFQNDSINTSKILVMPQSDTLALSKTQVPKVVAEASMQPHQKVDNSTYDAECFIASEKKRDTLSGVAFFLGSVLATILGGMFIATRK